MTTHFQLNPDFQPIFLPGHTANLYIDAGIFASVRIKAVRPLGVNRHDFGTIAADTLSQECTHLQMPRGELGQFRYIPRERFDVVLQNPSGKDQYQTSLSLKATRAEAWRIQPWAQDTEEPQEVRKAHWVLSEFFVLEDTQNPRFDLYPFAQAAQIEAHVDFYGIAYALEPLPKGARGLVDLWVRGWPSGVSVLISTG